MYYSSHINGINFKASTFMIGLSLMRSLIKLCNMMWTYFFGIIILIIRKSIYTFNNLYVMHLTLGLLAWNSLVIRKNKVSISSSLNSIP